MRLVVWGAGELGGRVGAAWVQSGQPVLGVTRSTRRHDDLRAHGIVPCTGNAAERLAPDDALLLALPGSANQQTAVEMLANTPPPVRAVLISSTGYYGTPHGRVDEDTPRGNNARAIAVEAAELAFRAWADERGIILRLGGLYCSGRGPLTAFLHRSTVPPGPPDRTLALIHYDDAAIATLAALRHASPESIYVGVVPPCPTRGEFYLQACRVISLSEPTFDAPLGLSPTEYNVARLRRDLLPIPAHPDWHDALRR
jgi:nucleoside-diphosphate-sugar epimerase